MKVKVKDTIVNINPYSVQVEITGRCNLCCKHCRAADLDNTDVDMVLFDKFIKFANLKPGFNIILSGGEPLLSRYFFDILKKVISLKPNEIVITTNGTMILDEHVDFFKNVKDCKLTIQVSLDSIYEEEYNKIRGRNFAYKNAISGIKKLVDNGIFTQIRATINPTQLSDMEKFVNLGISLGVKRIGFGTIIPTGRACNLNKSEFFIGESKLKFIQNYKYLKEKYCDKIEVVTHEPHKACLDTDFISDDICNKWYFGGCTAGVAQFNMENNGIITPCALLPIKITDLKNKSVEEAIKDYENSEIIKDLLLKKYKGKCGICKYKNSCGGCRAIPYSSSGDPLGEDISCFI